MEKNYVLIDYENVQPADIAAIEMENFHVLVFVGSKQDKVRFDIVSVLQGMGGRGSYHKIGGSGKNALDFHIAYYIGHLSAKEPEARFHILSKDTGFDTLLDYLKAKGVSARRVKNASELALAKPAAPKPAPKTAPRPAAKPATKPSTRPAARVPAKPASKPAPDRVAKVAANLGKLRDSSRPTTLKTLGGLVNNLFQESLSEGEVSAIVEELSRKGIIKLNRNKVSYDFPGGQP